ncbi:Inner membrane protein ycdZ [Leclercia adecarboxylata]|uniref:Inner membrane protein ycdZ n=1 Tax=Leclercia adecarboxylata TaxID=83655 RepID=A0A4U9HQH3_9ENTR|nr:Inner membrane protein ycdZ [Leclercia adecarboxylata]
MFLILISWGSVSAKMRAMKHTTFYCNQRQATSPGIWGWVAVSLGLLSWAGFLGCTAYFACPQGGVKGLFISACTLMSGVAWAMIIIHGSALAPHLEIIGYVMTGVVAFLMCIQGKAFLLSFVPGTFMGCLRHFCRAG